MVHETIWKGLEEPRIGTEGDTERREFVGVMNVLVVEALDGADVGADDGDLGGSVRGALPQQRLPRAVVVIPHQRLRRRVRAAPCGVRALDVVVEAAAPLRLRRRRLLGGGQVVAVHYCRPRGWWRR